LEERKGKTIKLKSAEEIRKHNLSDYAFVEFEDEKEARNAYNILVGYVQNLIDMTNDLGEVAKKVKEKGLEEIEEGSIEAGKPISVMLFQKAKGIADAFETVGKPAAFEYKYDGFRLQIHRKGEKISLYTRRLEEVTNQFPDVVKAVREGVISKEYILDSEVIGIDPKTGKWLPFQNISQRIKRKYDIEEVCKKIPVMIHVFDAIMVDAKTCLMSLSKRGGR